jgi:murein L,D-transpeptidase YcbB/YkuD
MKGLERNAALARRGVFLSVAVLAAVWNPSIGSTQQPDPVEQRVPVSGRWSPEMVGKLVKVIEGARAEGLDPAVYNLDGLRQAAESGKGPALDAAADTSAAQLAHDYYFGRVSDRADMGWMIQRPAYEPQELAKGLSQAIASGDIRKFYASLLPSDQRYAALREALAQTDDPALRDRLRVNMERWRWMPRGLGDDYLYVNVPSYKLEVMTGGASVASYDVVVGAPKTRTPMLASPTSSLVVNPWWNVPASIVKSSNMRPGKVGYQFKAGANGGYAVRQPPGPRNALGKIKFNLANDQAIYLHDTPAKAAFGRDERALSHGCIRVKNIDQLAAQLMGDDGGDTAQFDEALASPETATLRLPRTWQVYIVYFTLDGDDPSNLASYSDPYGYDAQILARLGSQPVGGRAMQVAALR